VISSTHKWLRRAQTLTVLWVVTAIVTASFVPLLLGAAVLDVARYVTQRRPWMAVRLLAFLLIYCWAECVGVLLLTSAWLFAGFGTQRATRLIAWTYRIQTGWVSVLFASIQRVFSLKFAAEGFEQSTPGPILVFIRHCSIIDTLLPTVFLSAAHGLRLRFVLKRELLSDPCLDIAGSRLPNYFAARDGADSAREIAEVSQLAKGLGPSDGVLLYPEGTRFSERKRAQLIAKLREKDPAAAERAEALKNVLVPRLGGALAVLDASDADVLFFAHHGLDGFASFKEMFRGVLVGRTVQLRVWRVARRDIPTLAAERVLWLHAQWQKLDQVIETLAQR
jgi:1-acyl-sn-glycerol-3-phosphate acyltransferase